MLMKNVITQTTKHYLKDTSGHFAVLFALISTVFIGSMAVAIDMTTAHKSKSELQSVADAIALMAVKNKVQDSGELTDLANAYLLNHFGPNLMGEYEVTSITNANGKAVVSLRHVFPVVFGQVFGKEQMSVGVNSTVNQSIQNLDLALVLDNTGSMRGKKLSALKRASNDLVDILYTEPAARDVTQIGLVPFSAWVNVGKDNFDPSWVDTTGLSPQNDIYFDQQVSRLSLYSQMSVEWDGCVENRLPPYDVDDTAPDSRRPETLFQPAFHPDMADTDAGGYSYLAENTAGNVLERLRDTTKYQGPLLSRKGPTERSDNSCDSRREVTPLTNNESDIRKGIRNMTAAGWTNIANGASWGFRLISPNAPFTQGRPYGEVNTTKAMVILTDGMQTMGGSRGSQFQSGYSPFGFLGEPAIDGRTRLTGSNVKEALDNKLLEVCSAAKAKDIVVYTITFELDDADTQNIMRACASDSGKYFDVTQSEELVPAFRAIASSLTELRVSR